MRVKKLELSNYRGIDKVSIDLMDNLNVFVGVNGSGKSSVLDAIVINLSWLINRIQREGASGKPITPSNIKDDADSALIRTEVVYENVSFNWQIVRNQRGVEALEKSNLTDVSELATTLQRDYRNGSGLPVIVYYSINRVVNNIVPDVNTRESIDTLDIYENALGGQTNYKNFFEWFRIQDDIVNERANSRTKWMLSNVNWIKRKTSTLLNSFYDLVSVTSEEYESIKERILYRFERDSDILFTNPRYLFHELVEIINFIQYSNRQEDELDNILKSLSYMLGTMAYLSDSRKDDLIEFNEYPFNIVRDITNQIEELKINKSVGLDNKKSLVFIWDALLIAVLLSLWWMSDKGKKRIEFLFSEFNPKKNNLTNHNRYNYFIEELKKVVQDDLQQIDKVYRNHGRELFFVTKCIEEFVPGYSNLRVKRVPRPQLLVDKFEKTLSLDQLSDGEKNLIAMVGDIARRLSIANPNENSPLKGRGIVLIDEIDLHLHPGWQRLMIPRLTKLFPNCQFIITTHSPQVISHTKPENLFLLKCTNNQFSFTKVIESYGKNTDRILEDILDVDARPKEEKDKIHELFVTIQEGDLKKAKQQISNLLELIGEDAELVKAQTLIKRREIIGK